MAKHQGEIKGGGAAKSKSARKSGAIKSGWQVKRDSSSGDFVTVHGTRVEAVMAAAERSGLLQEKSGRIGGRISPVLIRQAKAQTGIETDTELIEFALANVALEDKFAEGFKAVRGSVDPDLKLGF